MNKVSILFSILLASLFSVPASAEDYTVISEQPEGEVSYYDRLSYGWYIYAGGNNIQYGPIPGATKLVWAEDGSVYIQDPLTANKMGTYIKARKEGDKIVADFPQVLGEIEDNEGKRPLYIGVMTNYNDGHGTTYMPIDDKEKNQVRWTIHDNGTITMDHKTVKLDEKGKFADLDNLPDSVLGTYYYGIDDLSGDYGAIWNAVADWAQTYTPVETQDILMIPEGLNVEEWRMTSTKDTRMVDVAFDGDVVYIGRITQYVPGAIKGYVQDGKVYFPTTQYIGFNEEANANAWFISARAEYIEEFGKKYLSKFVRTDALVFDYDADKKTMTATVDDCFLINASIKETNHFEYVVSPSLVYLPIEGMNANPKSAVMLNSGEDKGNDGWLYSISIPVENVDGVALNTNNMFYNIYVNGELWEFNKDTYYHFNDNYTDIPYNYTDKYDLQLRGLQHDLYMHEEGINSFGVQSCFRGSDGVVYRSEIVTVGKLPEVGESTIEDYPFDQMDAPIAASSTFTYASDDAETEPSGTGKQETYDVAIALTNPALVGKVITTIEVPVLPSKKVGDLSVWLAKELKTKLVNGKNENIVNKQWTVAMPTSGKQQYVSVVLDTPYIIPEGGLYVGYSLTVNNVDRSEATQVPVVTAKSSKRGGFYLRTSRSYLSWQDRSEEFQVVAMTKVGLAGDVQLDAATLGDIPYSYVSVGDEQTVSVPVYNVGKNPITTLQYTSTIGDSEYKGTVEFASPIPAVYAYSENVAFTLPVAGGKGEYEVTVEVTGVNGVDNEATEQTKATGRAMVVKFVPKHLGLVEEFTGTWCGWCPAGYVAMEKMNELYPDFVGVAYHDNDPMTMKGSYPKLTSGFPTAAISREFSTHPYEATGMSGVFGMPQVWEYCCEGFVPVGIDLQAQLDGEGKVTVKSSVEWVMPADDPDADYRVEYVLVADGLTGDTQGWAQKNYFSTEATMMPYMEQFWHKDSYVRGLVFNDVAVMTSGFKGVDGSIVTTEPDVANEYTYTFDTSKALNTDGDLMPLHKDRLRVVAFVLKGDSYGTVVNAAKCDVKPDPSGITTLRYAAGDNHTACYNLAGQKVGSGYKGIVIKNGRKHLRADNR